MQASLPSNNCTNQAHPPAKEPCQRFFPFNLGLIKPGAFYFIYDCHQDQKYRLCFLLKMLDRRKTLFGKVVYFEEIRLCDSVHFIPLVEAECDFSYAVAYLRPSLVRTLVRRDIEVETPKELQMLVLLPPWCFHMLEEFIGAFEAKNSWLKDS